jgi:hypothetical protein
MLARCPGAQLLRDMIIHGLTLAPQDADDDLDSTRKHRILSGLCQQPMKARVDVSHSLALAGLMPSTNVVVSIVSA